MWLHPGHGPMLMKLADRFNLVWCTTWGAEANTWTGPRIGYRLLPVLDWAAFGASAAPCLRKDRGDHQVVGGVVVCNGCQGCSVPFRHMTAMSTLDRPASAAEVKAALYDPVLAHETPHGRMYSRTVGGAPVVPSITNILGVEDSGDRRILGASRHECGSFWGCDRAAFASAGPACRAAVTHPARRLAVRAGPRRCFPVVREGSSGGLDREWAGCRQRRDEDGSAPKALRLVIAALAALLGGWEERVQIAARPVQPKTVALQGETIGQTAPVTHIHAGRPEFGCQGTLVSAHWRPRNLPTGGHRFSAHWRPWGLPTGLWAWAEPPGRCGW